MAGINLDRERLEKLGEALPILFYALVFIAFLCAVVGSPGSGLLVLILAGCAHVARVGIEGFLEPPAKPAERSPRPARTPRRAAAAKIETPVSPRMDGKRRSRPVVGDRSRG